MSCEITFCHRFLLAPVFFANSCSHVEQRTAFLIVTDISRPKQYVAALPAHTPPPGVALYVLHPQENTVSSYSHISQANVQI